ncbi:MAG TPA: hypothetical protein VNI84_04410 [Pyrinomonadaceae bacterium]|nr:hypothetical protein [Pyrinomonadaceae bacterium]
MGTVTRNPLLGKEEGTRIIFQRVPPEFLKRKLEEQAARRKQEEADKENNQDEPKAGNEETS